MALATEQRRISSRLARLIAGLWRMLDMTRIDESWLTVGPFIEQAIMAEHATAVQAAIEDYMIERAAAEVDSPFAPPIPDLVLDAVRTSLRVTGPVAMKQAIARGFTPQRASKLALVQAQGAAARHALSGARDATLTAVRDDPAAQGWARLPRPSACPFCLMLATRGGAYKSKTTAMTSKDGRQYHDHCGCVAKPLFSDVWTPPAHVRRAEELWIASSSGKSGRDARLAFADAVRRSRADAATSALPLAA